MKAFWFLLILLVSGPALGLSGVHLNFKVNETYLILHLLWKKSGRSLPEISAIRSRAFEVEPELMEQLRSTPRWALFPRDLERVGAPCLQSLLDLVQKMPEYREIHRQTRVYAQEVEREWLEQYEQSWDFVRKLLREEFSQDIDVFVTHPRLGNGTNWQKDVISWGSYGGGVDGPIWKNYSTVYLWHEALHSFFKVDRTSHVIIQLIADTELRVHLDPSQKRKPFEGHPYLAEAMGRVFENDWSQFLSGSMTALDFVEYIRTKNYIKDVGEWVRPQTPICRER